MGLSGRKEKVLQAVVDSYINSCEPISSSELRDKHFPSLSSATLRNELASLEELGYLVQPHTSSGRVPTAEAYRLYVEKLMPRRKLSRAELKIIKRYFNRKITEIDDVLKSTAKVITEITNLTSVAYVQNLNVATIETIKFVKISDSSALVIIITDMGMLKDASMQIPNGITDLQFLAAGEFVSSVFRGKKISEIVKPHSVIKGIKKEYQGFFKSIIKILKSYAHDELLSDVILEGSSKILEQPEYSNLAKAKAMLEMLEAKEQLIPVLQNSDDMNLSIKIGRDELHSPGLPECAIVTATYTVGGKSIGNAGVIGPIRMDYPKVISVLDYLAKTINMLPDKATVLQLPEGISHDGVEVDIETDDDDDDDLDITFEDED